MPNSLSIASVLEKNRLDSDIPFLLALDIEVVNPTTGVVVEVLHVVRNQENVTINGVEYTAAMFDISFQFEAGSAPRISLQMNDYTGAIQQRLQEYDGGIGFNVTMFIVDGGSLTTPPDLVEYFQVTGSSASEYVVSFQLGGENEVMATFPRRRQTKDFCQWRYKDPTTCRYAGGLPDCDLTLQGPNGCAAHGNTVNFGAFPGLNSNGVRYV